MRNGKTIEKSDEHKTWDIYQEINISSKWSTKPLKVGRVDSQMAKMGKAKWDII